MATEKRLIDAYELMEHLEKCIATTNRNDRAVCLCIKCFVDLMHTVDAVEVVRCKDCQNGADDAWPDGKVWCRKMCRYMNKEGFCSEGVKANDA